MGSTYANLLVRVDPAGTVSADRVADVIRSSVLTDSETTEVDEGAANRTITIASRAGTPWIGVFDEAADRMGDEEALLGLGAALSTDLGTVVIATAVFDSDLALAWLIDGKVVDQMARPMDVLEEMTGDTDGAEGNPLRWAAAFPAIDTAALVSAWETDDVFAESRLIAAGAVLGIPREWAESGYRYLADADDPGDLTVLRFRGGSRRRGAAGFDVDDELEDLEVPGFAVEVGKAFDHPINIIGGAADARPMMIVVGGEALQSSLVTIEEARFDWMEAFPGPILNGPHVALIDGLAGGNPVRYGSGAIPPPNPAPRDATSVFGRTLVIRLIGRATTVGSGRLQVTWGSKDRFESEQATWNLTIEVHGGSPDA